MDNKNIDLKIITLKNIFIIMILLKIHTLIKNIQ